MSISPPSDPKTETHPSDRAPGRGDAKRSVSVWKIILWVVLSPVILLFLAVLGVAFWYAPLATIPFGVASAFFTLILVTVKKARRGDFDHARRVTWMEKFLGWVILLIGILLLLTGCGNVIFGIGGPIAAAWRTALAAVFATSVDCRRHGAVERFLRHSWKGILGISGAAVFSILWCAARSKDLFFFSLASFIAGFFAARYGKKVIRYGFKSADAHKGC